MGLSRVVRMRTAVLKALDSEVPKIGVLNHKGFSVLIWVLFYCFGGGENTNVKNAAIVLGGLLAKMGSVGSFLQSGTWETGTDF